MKYHPGRYKHLWKIVCCQKCGQPGLTLTSIGDNIYVHENEMMCAVALKRAELREKVRKLWGITTKDGGNK